MNIKCAQNGKWSYFCESAFDGRTVVLTNIFLEGIQELHRLSAMVDAERLEFAAIQTNFSNVVFEQETNQAFFSNLSALSASLIFWVTSKSHSSPKVRQFPVSWWGFNGYLIQTPNSPKTFRSGHHRVTNCRGQI